MNVLRIGSQQRFPLCGTAYSFSPEIKYKENVGTDPRDQVAVFVPKGEPKWMLTPS